MRYLCALISLLFFLPVTASVGAQETMAGYLREEYSCIMCHTDMRLSFLEGIHSRRGIECTTCHGGNPTSFEREEAHGGDFRGHLGKPQAVQLCLSCHGDIDRMRQFGTLPVTRDEYLLSRHGQRLLVDGDPLAPACGDCHGSHAIFPRDDTRSLIHSSRVAETCSGCHADPDRMPQGFPLVQYAEWEGSAHGAGLLRSHNLRSATCSSCHGSHSALPPGVSEVPNVCGKCHRLVRDAYFSGVHGAAATSGVDEVGCTSCHENHATETPPMREVGALCRSCHEGGTAADLAGLQLQEQVHSAERSYELAEEAIDEMRRAGEPTRDQEARILVLRTQLNELRMQAHSLNPETIDDLVRRVGSISREIRESAEVVEEENWERKLLLIPLWIGVLAGIALAIRKRRLLAVPPYEAQEGEESSVGGDGEGEPA